MPDALSAVICTYNRAKILDRTLASLAEVRWPAGFPAEVVVIANACTDATASIVRARAAGFPVELRLVEEPVTGLCVARNRGVREARHNVVALLDDDLWVAPSWAEGMREVLSTTPAAVIGGHTELWWDAVERPAWMTPGIEIVLSRLELGDKVLEMDRADVIGANFAFRREAYDAVGPFHPDLDRIGDQLLAGGETYFTRRAMARGFRVFYAPRASVKHWVAPHRVEAPYLTGVSRGTAYSIMLMKDDFGPLAAARAAAIACGRIGVGTVRAALARARKDKGAEIRALVLKALGEGQLRGTMQRRRAGPIRTPEHPVAAAAPSAA
jgi:glycosyltransferase involved in cell wall biosynthesis